MSNKRGEMYVTISVAWWGQCATEGCDAEAYAEDIDLTKRAAEKEIRAEGWRKRKGAWTCPDCIAGKGPVDGSGRGGHL